MDMKQQFIPTKQYRKDPQQVYSYGTAGFRMNAKVMKQVAYRVGILAALISQYNEGKAIGVMVTASHNPVEDNGVKLVDPRGEMITGEWEELATTLANVPDEQIHLIVNDIMTQKGIKLSQGIQVAVARDTRPSGEELCEAIRIGVLSLNPEAKFIDLGFQTTPQLHFSIYELNLPRNLSYIEHFSQAFENILAGRKLKGTLVIDTANGIGSQNTASFAERLRSSTNFDPIIINGGKENLNHQCGADFVKLQMKSPAGIESEWICDKSFRFASLDGDADRLVYFYFTEEGEFKLLDGDRIALLFAAYVRKLLIEANLADKLKFGVVQTAYANGASTKFLRSQGIECSFACTGVKNLHHVASELYDIAVYFEANGHGTILFGQRAQQEIKERKGKLALVMDLINQCVGDALSDLFLVEAILIDEQFSLSGWDALYTELPSRQLKVKVEDRSIFKTIEADTKLIEPAHLQRKIDVIVEKFSNSRAFVRPSGTEDIVRVYAEANTRSECDALAEEIAALIQIL